MQPKCFGDDSDGSVFGNDFNGKCHFNAHIKSLQRLTVSYGSYTESKETLKTF